MWKTLIQSTFALLLAISPGIISAQSVDFQTEIQPILTEHCVKCHGEKRALGRLRLHTPGAIQQFHEEHLLVAGKPDESELFVRITLPEDDKKRMPKQGDPLDENSIALIRKWITEGTDFGEVKLGEQPSVEESAEAESEVEPAPDAATEQPIEPASIDAIEQLRSMGANVLPLFAGSPLLEVSFALTEEPVGDDAIAALSAVSDQLVSLNLSGAEATSTGYQHLAELTALERLHLEHSTITDTDLAALSHSTDLQYLNLYGTQITDRGLKHLENLQNLRKLFLWQTDVSYDATEGLKAKIPGLAVDLGYDHPEVVRRRLARERDVAQETVQQSKQKIEELEQLLETAKEQQANAISRIEELNAQLESLESESE